MPNGRLAPRKYETGELITQRTTPEGLRRYDLPGEQGYLELSPEFELPKTPGTLTRLPAESEEVKARKRPLLTRLGVAPARSEEEKIQRRQHLIGRAAMHGVPPEVLAKQIAAEGLGPMVKTDYGELPADLAFRYLPKEVKPEKKPTRLTDTKALKGDMKQDYESFDAGKTWKAWGEPYSAKKGVGTGAGGAASAKWDKDAAARLDKFYGTQTDYGMVIDPEKMAEYQNANTYLAEYKARGLTINDAPVLAARRAASGGIDPIQQVIDNQRRLGKTDKEIKAMLGKSQFKSVSPRIYGLR